MISIRFAPIVCVLTGVALAPTLMHSYVGATSVDGRSTSAIPTTLAGYSAVPSARSPGWGGQRFDSVDWVEREYTSGADRIRLTVVRSYDLKALYHHPELAVAYGPTFGNTFDRYEVRTFPGRPEVPVHVLHPAPGRDGMALYALHYDSGFVAEPIAFQLRTAAELLFTPRRAMTLIFAHDLQVPAGARVDELPSVKLLFEAIDRFVDQPVAN